MLKSAGWPASSPQEIPMNRRKFLVNTGIVGAGFFGASSGASTALRSGTALDFASNLKLEEKPVAFTVPPLPYPFDALEPYIDAKTMEIHHDKHHGAYVTNLNKALEGHADLQKLSVEELLAQINKVPEAIRSAVRNNGGGHMNHSMFWKIMKKGGGGEPGGEVGKAISAAFGSFTDFKAKINDAGAKRFGSGWAWLLFRDGKLVIESSANQDNPIMDGGKAFFGVDVWEHAYYLKYQNRRPEYLEAWWNTINWAQVEENFAHAKK